MHNKRLKNKGWFQILELEISSRGARKLPLHFMGFAEIKSGVGVRTLVRVAVLVALFFAARAEALTVTATTSDNGYPAHLVSWTDASGHARSAMMVDQVGTGNGPYTGYMRQYSYVVSGVTRTCTGRSNDGGLETSGDGFVQNHGANGLDVSSGNGNGASGGSTSFSPPLTTSPLSHVTITYYMPGLINGSDGSTYPLPTTVQWFFADGRNDPIFSITQDATATSGNLGLDSRSPYGDMAYDGDASNDQTIGGDAWGDTYLFKTFDQNNATYPNQLTPQSAWDDTTPNTIPFAMSWAEPDTCNAEMGHVATVPITIIDHGQDNEDGTSGDDPRNKSSASGLPPATAWAYQINSYSFGGEVTTNDTYPYPTDDKHLTWGGNFGRIGGYNNGSGLSASAYSEHYNDPIGDYLQGSRVNSLLLSYSVYVVLGLHGTTANQYNASGAVGTVISQMQNVTAAAFTATTGTTVASGPEGIAGGALTTDITYSPRGYNPVYSTWEITASGNAVNATLTPASGKPLVNPVFLVDNYTSSALPTSISINGQSTSGTNYDATLDTAHHRLWITALATATSASPVTLVFGSATLTPQTITFPTIPNKTVGAAAFTLNATASSGLAVTYSLVSGPATLSGTNNATVTVTGAGTVEIQASQAGNGTYAAATPVDQSFTVTASSGGNSAVTVTIDASKSNFSASPTPISPLIYGDNGNTYGSYDSTSNFPTTTRTTTAGIPILRLGGDLASTYNWQIDAQNHAYEYYFESISCANSTTSASTITTNGQLVDSFFKFCQNSGASPMVTVPMFPYLANLAFDRNKLFSFPVSGITDGKLISGTFFNQSGFGIQQSEDSAAGSQYTGEDYAGNGYDTGGSQLTLAPNANSSSIAYIPYVPNSAAIQQSFVDHLVSTYGTASDGGFQYYILDNEPGDWYATHFDCYPTGVHTTQYLSLFNTYAQMIKNTDSHALVIAPEDSAWYTYFYSGYDVQNGAFGNDYYNVQNQTAYYPYLLSQFQAQSTTAGKRLLDYLSCHYYAQSGDVSSDDDSAGTDALRNQSTRELWDPNYVTPAVPNPIQGSGSYAPELIPMMQGWIAAGYPGTKFAITEYSFGDDQAINGATTEADVLGIFGAYGVDLATRYGDQSYTANPSLSFADLAIQMYTNYDGNGSRFGEASVSDTVPDTEPTPQSTYTGRDNFASYAATRGLDGALTVMVINKVLSGSTPVTINFSHFSAGTSAQVWQLTSSGAITQQTSVAVSANSLTATVPPQSVTLFVIPAAAGSTQTFASWLASYGISTSDLTAQAAATPEGDGVTNLMKYLTNINPTRPVNSTDRAALPKGGVDTSTNPGTTYVTLTYRPYSLQTGLTITVQTSPDLETWSPVTPDITKTVGSDLEYEVNTHGAAKDFIRLKVSQ